MIGNKPIVIPPDRCARTAATAAMLILFASAISLAQEVDPTHPIPQPVAPAISQNPEWDLTGPTADQLSPRGILPLSQRAEANITALGTGLDYVALVLDSDGVDNLYIKVQRNSGSGGFDHIGFYHGLHNATAWPGMTGGADFFSLAAADVFDSAHMIVTHNGSGTVTLRLENIDGGAGVLVYSRGGWTPRGGGGAGMGGYAGLCSINNWGFSSPAVARVCDTFNRPNGGLGGNWVTDASSASIVSSTARCGTAADTVSRHFYVGTCAGGISQVAEADVTVNGSTGLDFCALAFNYDGTDNLYVKVQQQDSGGQFDRIGFYDSVNGLAWAGQTGGSEFFTIPLANRFSSAHMKAILYPSGSVRLILSQLDGGAGLLQFERGGWTFLNGDGAGMGGYNGLQRIDNFGFGGSLVCDRFNRPNSATLGINWATDTGTAGINGFAAKNGASATSSRAIFTGNCGSCLDTTPPTVDVTGPAPFACVCNTVNISGTVSDTNGMYVGDVLEYRATGAAAWIQADSDTGARSGVLYAFNTAALTEGYYDVRVRGTNDCGLSNSDSTLIFVGRAFDTAVLRSPGAGSILGGIVCFDGSAQDNNCFRNYTLSYRALPAGAFAPVDPAFLQYVAQVANDPLGSWNTAAGPTAVPDGSYEVRLQGVTNCGNTASVTRTLVVDNTAPIGVITSPGPCTSVGGIVQIRGTASDANIAAWVVQYSGGASTGWVTINSGNTNVVNNVLANWNTAGLPRCAYVLRLVVGDLAGVNCSGNNHQAEYHVPVDLGRRCDFNNDLLCDGDDTQIFVNCLLGIGPCP